MAVQTGDRGLAARCWRKQLRVNPSSWSDVADQAALVLSTDELLSDVVTDGHDAVRFAERLYGDADRREERDQCLQAAITRLPFDRKLSAAERLFYEAHARAGLNQREQACERMTAALALEPDQANWREDYVTWLLAWERPDESASTSLDRAIFRARFASLPGGRRPQRGGTGPGRHGKRGRMNLDGDLDSLPRKPRKTIEASGSSRSFSAGTGGSFV